MKHIIAAEEIMERLSVFEKSADECGRFFLRKSIHNQRVNLSAHLAAIHRWQDQAARQRHRLRLVEERAHRFYDRSSAHLAYASSEEQRVLLNPGRRLSVINRLRYRRRALGRLSQPCEIVLTLAADHASLLDLYDETVDQFLEASARFHHAKRSLAALNAEIRNSLREAAASLPGLGVGGEQIKT